MGRPAKVRIEELEKLCAMQCPQAEIADFFGVSKQAIEKRIADSETLYPYTLDSGERVELTFRQIMDLGYSKGKISQRRALLKGVNDGEGWAVIWFGKQYMGQRDTARFEHGRPGSGALLDLASVEAYVRAAKPEGGL